MRRCSRRTIAGQEPQKGGMVIAHYGSGVYVYTAYAFYRQLPLGVPGAYQDIRQPAQSLKEPAAENASGKVRRSHIVRLLRFCTLLVPSW